jgi:hypothetical protein
MILGYNVYKEGRNEATLYAETVVIWGPLAVMTGIALWMLRKLLRT